MSALDDIISAIGELLTTQAQLTPDHQAVLQRYGGYQLQCDDNDTTDPPVYEGRERADPPGQLPPEGADGYVTVTTRLPRARSGSDRLEARWPCASDRPAAGPERRHPPAGPPVEPGCHKIRNGAGGKVVQVTGGSSAVVRFVVFVQ
jgi:hypothetical protein